MPTAPEADSRRTIRSVEITLDIVEALQEHDGAGVTTLAEELGHSKSTIHSHLRTLTDRELLVRDGDSYRLSLRVLDMATHVREQIGDGDVIREEARSLAEQTGEIAQFGIEEYGRVSYFCKFTGKKGVETASRVGTQQPMHSTALGKTILAYLPEERTEKLIADIEFNRPTPNTVSGPDELRADLDGIRERGYALDDEENIAGLRCVAAPVRDGEKVLGALSLSGPSSRFTEDRIHSELAEAVQRSANVIELNTKFS